MSQRQASFTKADVGRAIKGAESAGLKVARVEIDPKTGKIVVVSGQPEALLSSGQNEWDSVR